MSEAHACTKTTVFPNTEPSSIKSILPPEEASIATSLWPLQQRPDGRGRVKLNKYQRDAIDLACGNRFTMIQGPPGQPWLHIIYMITPITRNLIFPTGTGKSATGAHLAYALAMKLRKELRNLLDEQKRTGDSDEPRPRPCVMYCGPSQQSVNVVLGKLIVAVCAA